MPKIVSEEERTMTIEAIYTCTIQLIREKGIRAITVDDIITAVGIGKATFYTYYSSKEIWLYNVIKRCEKEVFSRLEEVMSSKRSEREKMVQFLKELYTAEDSLMACVGPSDLELIMRKLPARYHNMQREKSDRNFQTALQLMQLEHHQMEVVALLTDCLNFIASNRDYSRYGTNEALNLTINALADYVTGGKDHE